MENYNIYSSCSIDNKDIILTSISFQNVENMDLSDIKKLEKHIKELNESGKLKKI